MKPAISYLRVSTDRQGVSGLGLEAQRESIAAYCKAGDWEILAEFQDIESGKRTENRPELAKALAACKREKAALIVAKLDRLSRDLPFLATLIQQMERGKFQFRVANLPEANETTLELFAFMAQVERRMISTRTKEALAAKKARGDWADMGVNGRALAVKNHAAAYERAEKLRPLIEGLAKIGITGYDKIADWLNENEIETPNGGRWWGFTVQRVCKRIRIIRRDGNGTNHGVAPEEGR